MSLLNDTKHDTLRTQLSAEGHINDLEHDWLVALGATAGGTLVDMWAEVFDAAAIAPGQFNDRAVAYIVQELTPPSSLGSYNNHWLYYWQNATLAPPVPPPPFPTVAPLLHWFDFPDASTLFADTAGTIPITNGTAIARFNSKGQSATDLTQAVAGSRPTWHTGVLNGLPIGRFPQFAKSLVGTVAAAHSASTLGLTMALVTRRFGAGPLAQSHFLEWTASHRIEDDGAANYNSLQIGVGNTVMKLAPLFNNWYLVYHSMDPVTAGNNAHYGSPGPETPVILQTPADIPASGSLEINNNTVSQEHAEAFIWGGGLTVAERAALVTYVNTKYAPPLPHV